MELSDINQDYGLPQQRSQSNMADDLGSLSGNNSGSEAAPRTSNACDSCRKRKTKCSGTNPCAYCSAHKLECRYTYVRKKRTSYKKTPRLDSANILHYGMSVHLENEELKKRLGRLEHTVNVMNDKLDSLVKMNEMLVQRMMSFSAKPDGDIIVPSAAIPEGQVNKSNYTPSIAQTIQKYGTEKKARKKIMEDFVEMISTSHAVTIFSPFALNWLKKLTGEDFKILEPLIENHAAILKQLTHTLKTDFNSSESYTGYLLARKEIVKLLVITVMRLNVKSLLITDDQVCATLLQTTLDKFMSSTKPSQLKMNSSEQLLLSAMVCLGCVYASARLYDFKENIDHAESFGSEDLNSSTNEFINVSKKDLLELEQNSMRNCFCHFHKVVRHNEGQLTIFAILVLCLYLSSTIYSRCNYLILGVACKHAQQLGYHKIQIDYKDGEDIQRDVLSKKLLWLKCMMYDRDMSLAVEKTPILNDFYLYHNDFLNIAKIYVTDYCKRENTIDTNPDLAILKKISFQEGPDFNANIKALFQVLHNFATYSTLGFSLLTSYFSFTMVRLLARYSNEVCLESISKAIPTSFDSSVINDDDFLDSFFKALDVVNNINDEFKVWEDSLPKNIRPDSVLDVSMYKLLKGSSPNETLAGTKRRKANDGSKVVLFSGTSLDTISLSSELVRCNVGFLLITHFKYYYNLMKYNKLAHKACYILFSRRHLFNSAKLTQEQGRLEKTFSVGMKNFENAFLSAAKNILRLSFTTFNFNCQIIYWGAHFIIGAFYTILIHNLSRFACARGAAIAAIEEDCVSELHLLIDCYLCCLSKPVFVIRHLDNNFVERFGRRMIQLCLNNLKKRTSYDYDNDYKVIQFLAECQKIAVEKSYHNKGNGAGYEDDRMSSGETPKPNGPNGTYNNPMNNVFSDNNYNSSYNTGKFTTSNVRDAVSSNISNSLQASNEDFEKIMNNSFSIGFSKDFLKKNSAGGPMSHTFSNVELMNAAPDSNNQRRSLFTTASPNNLYSNSFNNSSASSTNGASPHYSQTGPLFTFSDTKNWNMPQDMSNLNNATGVNQFGPRNILAPQLSKSPSTIINNQGNNPPFNSNYSGLQQQPPVVFDNSVHGSGMTSMAPNIKHPAGLSNNFPGNVPEIDILSDNFSLDINDLDPFSINGLLFYEGNSPFSGLRLN